MSALQDGQTILFIGDSITDCGRRAESAPYGNGYVALFRELAIARWPEKNITVVNKGIGGNRVTDLEARWQDDVVRHRPEWLSIKIGINDLHSALRGGEGAVPPEKFASVYASILKRAAEWKPNLVLVSPFYLSSDTKSGSARSTVLDLLPKYVDTVERLAKEFGARYVPLQKIFERHLQFREPDVFCPEPVHPYRSGHLVIADAIMNAIAE